MMLGGSKGYYLINTLFKLWTLWVLPMSITTVVLIGSTFVSILLNVFDEFSIGFICGWTFYYSKVYFKKRYFLSK